MSTLFEQIQAQLSYAEPCQATGLHKTVIAFEEISVGQMQDGGWIFRDKQESPVPCVLASRDYQKITLRAEEEMRGEEIARFLIRTAFECRFCHEGIVSLHAACVEKDGYAVAFTGESGTGKSTRAGIWVDALGAEWISGDRPAVRLGKQGATACGVPWDGKEQIFRNVECPLKAILDVRRSKKNYIRRLSPAQARKVLMQQTFVPMWDTDAATMAAMNVRRLIQNVPVYRVFCDRDENAAKIIYDILFRHPEKIREEADEVKIKDGFMLKNIMDEYIVMPVGDNISKYDGTVVLNEVSAFVFDLMKNPVSKEDIVSAILNEFDVDEETVRRDLDMTLEKFTQVGLI